MTGEAQRRYRERHPDRVAALYQAWLGAPGNRERRREMNRQYRLRENGKVRDQEKAWHDKRPLYAAVSRAKKRAVAMGLPFDLDDRKLEQPELCPVLGVALRYGAGHGVVVAESPSIDRITGSLGYVHGNVRVISHRANTIKSDATAAELTAVLNYVLENT